MTESHSLESETVPSPEILLKGKDITKRYNIGKKQIRVLNGVELNVRQGEFLSIVGA